MRSSMKMRSSVRKCSSSCSLASLQLQFALERGHELLGVLPQHLGHGQSRPGRLSLMTTMRLAMVTSQSVKA